MSGSSPSSESPAADGRRLILVVDDEPAVRAMVVTSIRVRSDRYRSIEAGTAGEALAQAQAAHPDVVLLDVALQRSSACF